MAHRAARRERGVIADCATEEEEERSSCAALGDFSSIVRAGVLSLLSEMDCEEEGEDLTIEIKSLKCLVFFSRLTPSGV